MGATKSAATNSPIAAYIFPGVPSGGDRNRSGAPASRITTRTVRVLPPANAATHSFSVPAHTSAAAVPGSLASKYVPTALTARHPPNASPATGVNATLTSTSASRVAEHRTASPPAPASAASKSHALEYAATLNVLPRTTTAIVGASPRASNAG